VKVEFKYTRKLSCTRSIISVMFFYISNIHITKFLLDIFESNALQILILYMIND